jgi:hypothetical protein
MFTVGDYYRMYCEGKPFSDEELKDALEKLGKLSDDLASFDSKFSFSRNEINRVYYGLEDYYCARFNKVMWRPK